jgi:type I restriction enzyme M protein
LESTGSETKALQRADNPDFYPRVFYVPPRARWWTGPHAVLPEHWESTVPGIEALTAETKGPDGNPMKVPASSSPCCRIVMSSLPSMPPW